MALSRVVAMAQIVISLVTSQHAFASQEFHSPNEPFRECPRDDSTTGKEKPCQKPRISTQTTAHGVEVEESVVSGQNMLPPSIVTSKDTAQELPLKPPASEEPSTSIASSPGTACDGENRLGGEMGDFQCTNSDGQRLTFRFHRILRVDVRGLFLDMENVNTAAHEVHFAPFSPVAQSDQSQGKKTPRELISALVTGLKREFSVFHSSMSKETLRTEYGLVIPSAYYTIPNTPDTLELGEPGNPRPLLNFFVVVPEILINMCTVDVAKLTPEAVVSMSIDVVTRVSALHKLNILHRKIDCSSVLVSLSVPHRRAPRVYLANFTSAQPNTGTEQQYDLTAGMKYLDPYLAAAAFSPLKNRLLVKITKGQDAWATGLVLYFLVCNGHSDPFGIYAAPASKLVLLRRTVRLKEHRTTIKFTGCLPVEAHPAVPLLRTLVAEFLNPDEETRMVPEDAIARFSQLFGSTTI